MLVKELFMSAFVKGIGKTTGSVAIFGLMGCAWFLINRIRRIKSSESSERENMEEQNDHVKMDEVFDLSSHVDKMEEFSYKKIFDRL